MCIYYILRDNDLPFDLWGYRSNLCCTFVFIVMFAPVLKMQIQILYYASDNKVYSQEDINMKYIHLTDGRHVNLHL